MRIAFKNGMSRVASGLLVGGLLAFSSPVAVHAESGAIADAGSTKTQREVVNSECLKAQDVVPADQRSDCTRVITVTTSSPRVVSPQEILGLKGSMANDDYVELATKAAAGEVKAKSYNQQINQATDSVTQRGTFYYDGERAWVGETYKGKTGSHECVVDWAVGYGVDQRDCSESGTDSRRNMKMQWNFSPLANPIVSWDESYTIHLNSDGSTQED